MFLDTFVLSAEDVMFYSSQPACLTVSRRSHQIMDRFSWHLVDRLVLGQEEINNILIFTLDLGISTPLSENNKNRGWFPKSAECFQRQKINLTWNDSDGVFLCSVLMEVFALWLTTNSLEKWQYLFFLKVSLVGTTPQKMITRLCGSPQLYRAF